jgi:hypothetical protein
MGESDQLHPGRKENRKDPTACLDLVKLSYCTGDGRQLAIRGTSGNFPTIKFFFNYNKFNIKSQYKIVPYLGLNIKNLCGLSPRVNHTERPQFVDEISANFCR